MTTSFKTVFFAIIAGAVLVLLAYGIHRLRPDVEVEQPTSAHVAASGKCATCHQRETSAIMHQFNASRHAQKGVNCLDCHGTAPGQQAQAHKGFEMTQRVTAKNCAGCHATEYEQYARSRHAGPAWGAVVGSEGFSAEQIAHTEKYHPGTVRRPANQLAKLEGPGAIETGCAGCHEVGRPNADGSFGTCTHCHARHNASIRLARQPATCGQCHMGPDHAQLEIYRESKHGVLFHAGKEQFNLDAPAESLSTRDMPVPTCATCHMSGLEGLKVTHDTTGRLSWYLFSAVSEKRPDFARRQSEMKDVCKKCHTTSHVDAFYEEAEVVLGATNDKSRKAQKLMGELREQQLLTPEPFDEPLEFLEFDLWHYYGRTAKHGAFMGGADFVQWHGNYELLHVMAKMKKIAKELRQKAESESLE